MRKRTITEYNADLETFLSWLDRLRLKHEFITHFPLLPACKLRVSKDDLTHEIHIRDKHSSDQADIHLGRHKGAHSYEWHYVIAMLCRLHGMFIPDQIISMLAARGTGRPWETDNHWWANWNEVLENNLMDSPDYTPPTTIESTENDKNQIQIPASCDMGDYVRIKGEEAMRALTQPLIQTNYCPYVFIW